MLSKITNCQNVDLLQKWGRSLMLSKVTNYQNVDFLQKWGRSFMLSKVTNYQMPIFCNLTLQTDPAV